MDTTPDYFRNYCDEDGSIQELVQVKTGSGDKY